MTIISIQVPYNSVSVVIFFKTMYKKQLLGSVFVILNLEIIKVSVSVIKNVRQFAPQITGSPKKISPENY